MRQAIAKWVCVVGVLGAASCTYESPNLDGVLCDEPGLTEAGRRCEDGVWVSVEGRDDMNPPADMTAPLDLGQDMAPDLGEDMTQPVDMGEDMTPDDMGQCVPRTAQEVCTELGFSCGEVQASNNCGAMQSYSCGQCQGEDTCGGGGEDNRCGCPCKIGGKCYNEGTQNPDNPCQVCAPMIDRNDWSTAETGTECDDGLFCTVNDVCNSAGQCRGVRRDCAAELGIGQCEIATCNDRSDICVPQNKESGVSCTLGGTQPSCVTGSCDGSGQCAPQVVSGKCLIGTSCFNASEANPDNECQRCVPAQSATAWSPSPANTQCGTSTACNSSFCDASGQCVPQATGCQIGGACYAAGATLSVSHTCRVCDPTQSTTEWSTLEGTCWIGNRCHVSGAQRSNTPPALCETCVPNQSQTEWISMPALCSDD